MAKTRFLYFGNQYIGEADETNTVTKRYVNEPGVYTDLIGEYEAQADAKRFHHFDAIGSTRIVTDSDEDVKDSYTYDSWGNVLSETGIDDISFKFVGRHGYYRDDNIGMYYIMARHYNPSQMRWISVDPLRFIMPYSSYVYSNNSPLRLYDASGLFCTQKDPCEDCNNALRTLDGSVGPVVDGIKEARQCLKEEGCPITPVCRVCDDFGPQSPAACSYFKPNLDIGITLCCQKEGFTTGILHEMIHAISMCRFKNRLKERIKKNPKMLDKVLPYNTSCVQCVEDELTAYMCSGDCKTALECYSYALESCSLADGSTGRELGTDVDQRFPGSAACSGPRSTHPSIALQFCSKAAQKEMNENRQAILDWIKKTYGEPPYIGSDPCKNFRGCKTKYVLPIDIL